MSKFKLGGVPSHATDVFYALRDRVGEEHGAMWSKAIDAALEIESPHALLDLLKTCNLARREKPKPSSHSFLDFILPG